MLSPVPESEIAIEYCRRARKIRPQSPGNPAKIQRQLRQLANPPLPFAPRETDYLHPPLPVRHRQIDWSQSAVLGHRAPAARNFADLVATRLTGAILPWSDRQTLLREAARRQINRFEANLIIAAVQNHLHTGHRPAHPPPKRHHPALKFAARLAVLATVETLIVLAVWRLAC